MNRLFLVATLFFTLASLVDAEEVTTANYVDLTGQSLPGSPNPILHAGGIDQVTSVSTPLLRLYRASHSRGVVLLFPGGGYHILAITHEGVNIAQFLNRAGFDCAVLEYAVNHGRDAALADAKSALQLLQTKGVALGLNTKTLGVMGFSAGGHLATRLVHDLGSAQPFDKVILIYPAYLNAPDGITPESVPPADLKAHVFVMIGSKDRPGWIAGAQAYVDHVKAGGGTAEFHLLPGKGHGFGIMDTNAVDANWDLLSTFLK